MASSTGRVGPNGERSRRVRIRHIAVWSAICLLSVSPLFALDLAFGLKGGLNLSAWRGAESFETDVYTGYPQQVDPYEYRSVKFGPNAGLFVGIKPLEFLEIQPEVAVSVKGLREVDRASAGYSTAKFVQSTSVTYLEFPVLLKLLVQGLYSVAGFYTGPALAVRTAVGGYARLTIDGDSDRENYTSAMIDTLNDMLARVDFGLASGIMFHVGRGPVKFVIDFRYTHGFAQVYDNIDLAREGAVESGDWDLVELLDDMGVPKHRNMNFSTLIGFCYDFSEPKGWGREIVPGPGDRW
jgi:hypothetical protein